MTSNWHEAACSQGNVITAAQLAKAGVSRYQRRRMLDDGVLDVARRGVYMMAGTPPSWPTSLWCGVLAAGPSAVAYRQSAASWWGMDGIAPGVVEVAVPAGHQSRRAEVHRVGSLVSGDATVHLNLPITTVGRTLVDLSDVVSASVLERSMEWALRQGRLAVNDLERLADRCPRIGARRLLKVLAARPGGAPATESDAETLFVQLARQSGLPDPIRQYQLRLRGRLVRLDFAWPVVRLAVEIDGAAVHGPDALPADLRRQNRVVLDGWMILRYPWSAVAHDWRYVIDELRQAWALRSVLL
jgi:very-short-patch-repair endonuclease